MYISDDWTRKHNKITKLILVLLHRSAEYQTEITNSIFPLAKLLPTASKAKRTRPRWLPRIENNARL